MDSAAFLPLDGDFYQDAAPDIFADINWHDGVETQTFVDEPCLDCLISSGAECESCSMKSSGACISSAVQINNNSLSNSSTPSLSNENGDSPSSSGTCFPEPSSTGRFSKAVVSILRVWFNEHKNNPYPSSEQKDDLAMRSGLSRSQVSLWLANTRRRHRAQRQAAKASTANAIETEEDFHDMKPMDRWKYLPIDYDTLFTPLENIRTNAMNASLPVLQSTSATQGEYAPSQFGPERSTTTVFDNFWAQSMASFETGMTSMIDGGSTISDGTFLSTNPSASATSSGRIRRRRKQHVPKGSKAASITKGKPFQCTFCSEASFNTKYDWQRHEKSQHLSLETWICCRDGATIEKPSGTVCAFCDCANPDKHHLELHHYSTCQEKPLSERSFYRKDHLQQHLKLMHDSKCTPDMDVWKLVQTDIRSRCGFCEAVFETWSSRVEHIASHFRNKADMKDWVGDLGLEPHIVSLLEKCSRQYHTPPPLDGFAIPKLPRSQYNLPQPVHGVKDQVFSTPAAFIEPDAAGVYEEDEMLSEDLLRWIN